jgi:hypothetical protein
MVACQLLLRVKRCTAQRAERTAALHVSKAVQAAIVACRTAAARQESSRHLHSDSNSGACCVVVCSMLLHGCCVAGMRRCCMCQSVLAAAQTACHGGQLLCSHCCTYQHPRTLLSTDEGDLCCTTQQAGLRSLVIELSTLGMLAALLTARKG